MAGARGRQQHRLRRRRQPELRQSGDQHHRCGRQPDLGGPRSQSRRHQRQDQYSGVGEVINLAFLARALQTTADANILSTPTIQTLDNEEAKFLVGQNIPLITGAYANAGGTQWPESIRSRPSSARTSVFSCGSKPQITEGGVVRLRFTRNSVLDPEHTDRGAGRDHHQQAQLRVDRAGRRRQHRGARRADRGPTENSRSSLPLLGRIPGLGYLFSYENRGRTKTNFLVFLRPYVVRDESTSSGLALDRYAYIRGQVASNSKPDNLIFKGFQGTQLPEAPPVPPAMRQKAPETTPGGTVPPAAPVDPAGLGGRDTKPVPAPQSAAPPASQPPPAPVSTADPA